MHLYRAIHIDQSTASPRYHWSSTKVKAAYKHDHLIDYTKYFNYMIENNFPFIVMAGEYDMLDGAKGQQEYMRQILSVSSDFWN